MCGRLCDGLMKGLSRLLQSEDERIGDDGGTRLPMLPNHLMNFAGSNVQPSSAAYEVSML